MSNAIPFPSVEEGTGLYAGLLDLAPDPVAPAEFCNAYIKPLKSWLEAEFPCADPDLVLDAVHQTLIDLVLHPRRYNPQRLELGAFLRMAARRDLLNLISREARHQRKRRSLEIVEDDQEGRNSSQGEAPDHRLIRMEEQMRMRAVFQRVREACTAEEQSAFDLMVAEERRTEAYAAALGLGGKPEGEQEREVKRVKDRLKKRLLREGGDDD